MHPTAVKIEKQEDSPLDVFALVSRHGLANERMTSVASVVLVWSFFVTIVTDTRVAEGSGVERLGLDALGELQAVPIRTPGRSVPPNLLSRSSSSAPARRVST